ncbi:MAG: hypothetical protein ACXVCY_13570 [Pseudobdellovibrionaceae bacterium]
MRQLLVTAALALTCTQALATEITPANFVGNYDLTAKIGAADARLEIHIVNAKEFQLQSIHPDGKRDELCNGIYNITATSVGKDERHASKIFKGTFTCPSNRTQQSTLNLDFTNKTMEDLAIGTTVPMMSSVAPTEIIKAFIKKMK